MKPKKILTMFTAGCMKNVALKGLECDKQFYCLRKMAQQTTQVVELNIFLVQLILQYSLLAWEGVYGN